MIKLRKTARQVVQPLALPAAVLARARGGAGDSAPDEDYVKKIEVPKLPGEVVTN